MAKAGAIVEFKARLHGIDAPQNLGVQIDRFRKKGVPWVRLVTIQGLVEIKAEHVTKKAFRDAYQGDLGDHEQVKERLRFFLGRHADGDLEEQADDDLAGLEESLWHATCHEGRSWSEDEIAAAHYGDPSPLQRKQVREALQRCRRPGIGRFEVADKGDQWRPWTPDEVEAMRAGMAAIGDLRARLVREEEDEEGRFFVAERGDDLREEPARAWVQAAMVQFIEHDGVPDKNVAGIAGYGVTAAFGMDLHRTLGFLAKDWIAAGPTTRSSDYIHFLLEAGWWTPEDAVASLMRRHVNQEAFFEHTPDEEAERLALELPEPAPEDGRDDLRQLSCYTIDPPDARDFDDAVGIEETADGHRLWVHIADVSHYVRSGSPLDRHARKRATSVYLPGRVLPMLPARIADHLCSLRDDGDRFAVSAALNIDAAGVVTGAKFYRSLIRVDENLSYQDALDRRDAHADIGELFDLAGRMQQHRRGLALETGEIRISVEESGFEAQEKFGNEATRMIETFMVAANEAVARHLSDADVPLLFRCHPLPDASKAERFQHQMEVIGEPIEMDLPSAKSGDSGGSSLLDQLKAGGGSVQLFGGGLSSLDAAEPEEPSEAAEEGFAALDEDEQDAWLQPFLAATDVLAGMQDRGLAQILTYKLLSCMGQAYYTPANVGHFGLASTHYCHFTSPIRRYPDLIVHRNLKWLIDGGSEAELPHPAANLETLCDHCSDQERAASALERRLKASCLVLAGVDVDEARITGISPHRLFLDAGGIDASVSARDWPGGPYHVDEWESMLFLSDREAPARFDAAELSSWRQHYDEESGEQRRVRARLGDRIGARLAGQDVAAGRTDATITRWPGEA